MQTHHITSFDGTPLTYHRLGDDDGEPIVLIQGLGMPGLMWRDLGDELVREGFCVVMPDNRGVGQSGVPAGPYKMKTLSGDIAAVIQDAFGGPAIVLGGSMGGMIAQHVAFRHPALVRGVLLLSTTCGMPFGKPPAPHVTALLFKSFLRPEVTTLDEVQYVFTHERYRPYLEETLTRWKAQQAEHPTTPRGFIGQFTAAMRHNSYHRLARIVVPTRLVAGADDRLIPAMNTNIIGSRIPHAHVRFLPETGHLLYAERPDAVREEVLRLRDTLHASATRAA